MPSVATRGRRPAPARARREAREHGVRRRVAAREEDGSRAFSALERREDGFAAFSRRRADPRVHVVGAVVEGCQRPIGGATSPSCEDASIPASAWTAAVAGAQVDASRVRLRQGAAAPRRPRRCQAAAGGAPATAAAAPAEQLVTTHAFDRIIDSNQFSVCCKMLVGACKMAGFLLASINTLERSAVSGSTGTRLFAL